MAQPLRSRPRVRRGARHPRRPRRPLGAPAARRRHPPIWGPSHPRRALPRPPPLPRDWAKAMKKSDPAFFDRIATSQVGWCFCGGGREHAAPRGAWPRGAPRPGVLTQGRLAAASHRPLPC
jgi:hypothetical protein